MSKKGGGGKSQAQLDARSRSMNSQDVVGQAAMANAAAQRAPGAPAYQAVQDNKSVQMNPPAAAPKPTKPPVEGNSSSSSV